MFVQDLKSIHELNLTQRESVNTFDFIHRKNLIAWFTKKLGRTNPGSLSSYSHILKNFLKFLLLFLQEEEEEEERREEKERRDTALEKEHEVVTDEENRMRPPSSYSTVFRNINNCLPTLDYYCKKLTGMMRVEKLKNQLGERKRLLGKSDISSFETSAYVVEVLNRLRRLGPGDAPDVKFAINCRNVLVAMLLQRSIQRSGCLSGLTIGELKNAEIQQSADDNGGTSVEDRSYVISVCKT